jgi:hypothetical protein
MSAVTRRGAFFGSVIADLVPAPTASRAVQAPGSPDAELLRLCVEFSAADASMVRWETDISLLDNETGNALVQRWDSPIPPIAMTPAVTAAGRRAKAAAAFSVMRYADEVISTEHHDLIRSALADVLAGEAA